MKKRSRSKGSVLSRQKPRKGAKKARPWRLVVIGSALVAIAGLGLWISGIASELTFDDWFVSHEPPPEWRVSLNVVGDAPLPAKTASLVVEIASEALGDGSPDDLAQVARLIQKEGLFARVHLVRIGSDHVIAQVQRRAPVACALVDRLRFVTESAAIYGEAAGIEDCPGPVLAGFFSGHEGRFRLGEDAAVVLTAGERTHVQEALELLADARSRGHDVHGIRFEDYRGFAIELKGQGSLILVGMPPFADALDRLAEVLGKLERRGEVAERIELDYQGKAFVKLKKL